MRMRDGACDLWTRARGGFRSDALEPEVINCLDMAWKKKPGVFSLRPDDVVVLGKYLSKCVWTEGTPPFWMEANASARPQGSNGSTTEYRVTVSPSLSGIDRPYTLLLCSNWSDRPMRVRVNDKEVSVVSQDAASNACVDELCNGFGAWYAYSDVQFALKGGQNRIEFVCDVFSPWINAFILRPLNLR